MSVLNSTNADSKEDCSLDLTRAAASPIDFDELTFIEKYIQLNKDMIEGSDDVEVLDHERIAEYARTNNIESAPKQAAPQRFEEKGGNYHHAGGSSSNK